MKLSLKSTEAKVVLRNHVAEAMGGLGKCHVFDAFAGAGEMHGAIWSSAASYVGCDKRYFADGRLAYVCENTRVLRAIDLRHFNLFDLDASKSPWDQAVIIAARRRVAPGERIGLLLTEGLSMKLRMNGLSGALSNMSGVSAKFEGKTKLAEKIYDRAIVGLAARMNCTIAKRWQAIKTSGSNETYIALVLEGKGGEPHVVTPGIIDAVDRLISETVEHADVSNLQDEGGFVPAPSVSRRRKALAPA